MIIPNLSQPALGVNRTVTAVSDKRVVSNKTDNRVLYTNATRKIN